MGGITNIHHATQVLDYAGRDIAVQAQTAPLNKSVLLVGRSFTTEELQAFSSCLRTPARDTWLRFNDDGTVVAGRADDNIPGAPTLHTSPGLVKVRSTVSDILKDKKGNPVELAWIIIVRGRSGASYGKVRVFYSPFATATGILEEAFQSYSVAFSAAVLKRDLPRLGDETFDLLKVGSLKELAEKADDVSAKDIPICC